MSGKIKVIIIIVVLVVAFACIGVGLYCAWPAITGTITDSKYYTSDDLQNAYDKGFDDAFKNKDELTQQIDYYVELTDTYYASILDYQAQIKDYETMTENNKNKISILEQNKAELQSQVSSLEKTVADNEDAILSLNNIIAELNVTVSELEEEQSNNSDFITSLQEQVASLQNQVQELSSANSQYLDTIDSLNSTITALNSQIDIYEETQLSLNSQIVTLQSTVAELEESVKYYEELVASYNFDDESIITFMVNDKNYDVIVTSADSSFDHYVVEPRVVGYEFLGWSIDGVSPIELQGYFFPEDTTLYALFEETTETFNIDSSVRDYWSSANSLGVTHTFNSYIKVTGSIVEEIEIINYDLSKFINISEPLSNFATISENVVTVTIPMSFIEENYSSLVVVENAETYFMVEYSFVDGYMNLTDFYIMNNSRIDPETYYVDIENTEEVEYLSTLNSNFYEIRRIGMDGVDLWTAILCENDGIIQLACCGQFFTFTKSNSNIYYINETYNGDVFNFSFVINSDNSIEILSYDMVNGGALRATLIG